MQSRLIYHRPVAVESGFLHRYPVATVILNCLHTGGKFGRGAGSIQFPDVPLIHGTGNTDP